MKVVYVLWLLQRLAGLDLSCPRVCVCMYVSVSVCTLKTEGGEEGGGERKHRKEKERERNFSRPRIGILLTAWVEVKI